MNADELRDRQRKRVKQRYYKTLSSLSQSRELVQQLTDQHHRLLELHEIPQPRDARQHELRRYAEAAYLADALRQEKQRLMELLDKREKFQDRLITLLDEWKRDQMWTNSDTQADPAIPFISFRPLTLPECEAISRFIYGDIQCFLSKDSHVSTHGSVLGWCDKREMVGSTIKMSFEKVLDGVSPFDLALRTWQLIQNHDEHAKLFSASLGASIRCLQVVNDTNAVLFSNFTSVDGHGSFRSLYLVTFVKIDFGFAVLLQSVDRSQFEVQTSIECEHEWLELHLCYLFRAYEPHSNQIHTLVGGKMTGISAQIMVAWMLELLLICLRWESRIIGPRALVISE